MGASAGGMVMGPVAASLFADYGWREVYLGFGIAVLALAPALGWLTVGRPEERGLALPNAAAMSRRIGRQAARR